MKKLIQLTPLLILLLSACNDSTKEEEIKPANGMDAASKFLRAALDGDYKKARTYLVKDSTNNQMIDIYEKDYNNNLPPEDKTKYKSASIRFGAVITKSGCRCLPVIRTERFTCR